MDYDDDDGIHRLEGSKNEVGGLIIKKKPVAGANFEFKLPTTSLLGLDKLAGRTIAHYHPASFVFSSKCIK